MTRALLFVPIPLAFFLACSGADVPIGNLDGSCPADEACFGVESGGACSIVPGATCAGGSWQCPAGSTLATGCSPDGGVTPVVLADSGLPGEPDTSVPSHDSGASDGTIIVTPPSDAGSGGMDSASPDDGGKPCVTTADCGIASATQPPWVCAYPIADLCSATGVCLPAGPACASVTPAACACDGTETSYGSCSGYPTGYAGSPVAVLAPCGQDAAAVCATGGSFPTPIACSGAVDNNPVCTPYQARCVGGYCTCGP